MSTLLNVNNLSVEFRVDHQSVQVLHDISFSLNKNETLGIVGESGSGKSVTSLAIMGLVPSPPGHISKGEILFYRTENQPEDLLTVSKKKLRSIRGKEIAMIFQEPMTSMNPVYTCGNQVVEVIRQHLNLSPKEAKEKTIALFDEVQLPRPDKIFNAYPHQLSGGQKQRIMIAMAISCEPFLLIADEPTTALDVTIQKKIIDLISRLKEKYGMSILFISHDLGLISSIADKALVMYKGQIVEQNSIRDIFNHPQHAYTKGLLACRPPLNSRPKKLLTVSDFIHNGNESKTIEDASYYAESLLVSEPERKMNLQKIYSSEPILKIKNLQTFIPIKKNLFGQPIEYVKAVNDVSFDVYPGETLGLVGESGCGKTTLGRTILNLIHSTGGKIFYKDQDLSLLSNSDFRKLRKELQIVFQDPYSSLNPRQTIGSAITEPMKIHSIFKSSKQRQEKGIELLNKVGLEEQHYYRYPHEFSGGQRQRICIARALALNPQLIICDESVSALDVSVQAQVLNLLNQLKLEYNFTYIFISHDLSVVKFMSDKIIVMKEGKILEAGEADELYKYPKTNYTKNLIQSIPENHK